MCLEGGVLEYLRAFLEAIFDEGWGDNNSFYFVECEDLHYT